MKLLLSIATALVLVASPAFAQTEGRIGIGGFVTLNSTTDDEVDSFVSFGPQVRLNPQPGWGPAAALNWFQVNLQNPAGGGDDFAQLRFRPLMAGVSYAVASGPLLTSFSIITGPSFNRARFRDAYAEGPIESIDADNSWAFRSGVGVTWTVAPRVGITGFGGYLINRPGIVYRDRSGQEFRDHWNSDSLIIGVGAVYSVF